MSSVGNEPADRLTQPKSVILNQAPSPLHKRRPLGKAFATLSSIEMVERLTYFAVRTVTAIYIMQADEPGGLHLTAADKGSIYKWWFFFQSILPMVTGGYADRYGFKRVLGISISLNVAGYVLMAFAGGYGSFLAAVIVLASGTAFFKPSVQGALAQNLDKSNSSLGWGIFYWVVNFGSAIAPLLATLILGNPHTARSWRNLFLVSAALTTLNLFLLLTFKDVPSGANKKDSPLGVFFRTLTNIFEARLIAFLLIMSGFWLMMFQLWDLQPNFINDWVDSTALARGLSFLPESLRHRLIESSPVGPRVPQQILLAANPVLVVCFVVPLSALVGRMRTLTAMLFGMAAATLGILIAGLSHSAWPLLGGVLFFSLGEMLTGPKKNEYLSLIAPPGKKGLYLGYVNIPAGLGGFLGSQLAGYLYGQYGEKATLALKYLAERTPLGAAKHWDGAVSDLETCLGIPRTRALASLQEALNLDAAQATQLLWNTYHPQIRVWLPFAAVGAVSAIGLGVFSRMARRWQEMNV